MDWLTDAPRHSTGVSEAIELPPLLLAEDNEDEILTIYEAFKKAHILNRLYVVFDGQHAVDYLAGRGRFSNRKDYPLPCMVLLKTDLEIKDGFEVVEWMRQESSPFRMMPAVLIGSSSRPEELRRALTVGASDYVPTFPTMPQMVQWAKSLKKVWLEVGTIYTTLAAYFAQ